MFKEVNQFACLFNTRKIDGYMEAKYSVLGWDSPCVLCSLFPYDYIFPNPNSSVGTLPISNCSFCPFVLLEEGIGLIPKVIRHVKQVDQQELLRDIFRNANDMRRGICCYA